MLFKDLSLIEPLLRALETEGYERPTPIQEQAIPPVLRRRDLLGCAQTGTGKTAAFALPILQILHAERAVGGDANSGKERFTGGRHEGKRPIRALILTPTRELAIQIGESFTAYGRNTGVRNLVIFGGVGQTPQTDALRRGADILVATPGRLLDLMNQGFISLRDIGIFVLDEADRMLDMGFIHDVKKVIAKLPEKRQTLFFSATMPPEIAKLADSILTDPVKVAVTPVASTAEKVSQAVYFVEKKDKKLLLNHLLKDKNIASALVFTRTKHGANKVAGDLVKAGIRAEAIHGNKSQNARQAALGNFKAGRIRALVATDIAARGIDIEELSHVINFDLPNIPETYVHRIGRTGRAGASGIALSFCDSEELPYLKDIQKLTGQQVPVVKDHPFAADLIAPAMQQPGKRQENGTNGKQPQHPERNGSGRNPGGNNSLQREATAPLPPRRPDGPPRHAPAQKQQPQQRTAERQKPAHDRHPQPKHAAQDRPAAQNKASNNTENQGTPGFKKRFSSILEVAAIEKQDFRRKDKPNGQFGDKNRNKSSFDAGRKNKNRRRMGDRRQT